MNEHPRVTDDPETSTRLIAEYMDADDTGDAFTDYIRSLGYRPPLRPEVITWGICITGDDEGREWLAWDAEEVRYPVRLGKRGIRVADFN